MLLFLPMLYGTPFRMGKRNPKYTFSCVVCGKQDHPYYGREARSFVCSLQCNGVYQRSKPVDVTAEFMSRVRPNHLSGCWEWTGAKNGLGYGLFRLNGKAQRAHRVSILLHKKKDPTNMVVCHACDNPSCVNPDHLWLGTQKDNMRDMRQKGRSAKAPSLLKGEKHPRSKLTSEQVLAILGDDRTHVAIAAQYGVSKSLIRSIKSGKTWRHVTLAPT